MWPTDPPDPDALNERPAEDPPDFGDPCFTAWLDTLLARDFGLRPAPIAPPDAAMLADDIAF